MACNCRPYLATANSAVANVPTGGNIPLGSAVGRECQRYRLAGDSVSVNGGGESVISGTVTIAPASTASTAVNLAIEVRRNGQAVQGGFARTDSTARWRSRFA